MRDEGIRRGGRVTIFNRDEKITLLLPSIARRQAMLGARVLLVAPSRLSKSEALPLPSALPAVLNARFTVKATLQWRWFLRGTTWHPLPEAVWLTR